jgi:hypothetical protein
MDKRFEEIEGICNTYENGTDAAIIRLQKVVRQLIKIVKDQEMDINRINKIIRLNNLT